MREFETRDEFIRKRAARQKKIRKRRLRAFFIFSVIMLICVAAVLSLTVFFPIENLTANGSKVYDGNEIIKASGIEKGDNLFAINRADVLNTLKTKLPFIESVEFKRKLPGTLNITVKDADEYYCILSENKYYTVSKSNWVLEESDTANKNVFEVRGVKAECKVGSLLKFEDEENSELIQRIMTAFNENNLKIDYIDISDSVNLNLGANGRFTVVLGTANNIEEKVKHLAGMIEKISQESEGKINLSMWTPDNTSATFIPKKDK